MRWDPGRAVRDRALAEALRCVLGQDTLLSWCLFPPRRDTLQPDGALRSNANFSLAFNLRYFKLHTYILFNKRESRPGEHRLELVNVWTESSQDQMEYTEA